MTKKQFKDFSIALCSSRNGGIFSDLETGTLLNKPDSSGKFFYCSSPEYAVILRHEVSATDGTDASSLCITEIKKTRNE